MLRITIQERPEAITFLVEGKLVGEWARELERSWKEAASIRPERSTIVDLTEALFIDEEGRRVLTTLFQGGAVLRAGCPMTESVVSEIRQQNRRSTHRWILHGILLLLLAPLVRAAPPEPVRLTLRDAVQTALKQNPQVKVANLNVAVSQENQTIARSALLPQAALGISEGVRRENLQTALGMSVPGFPEHSGPFWVFQGGPTASAPVLDLTAWHRWRQSKENTTGTRAEELTVREQYVQLVVSQYLGSLRAEADVSAAQSRVDLAKALFDQATDVQKNGVGIRIDTLRANVQYQNEQQRLIQARTALATSLFGLARLLNLDPGQPIELADSPEFFRTPTFSADETLERAFIERPEMKALASRIRSAQLEKKAAGDARIPRIELSASWSEQGLTPATAIPAYDIGAALDVPLFTGGRIRAQMTVAELELKKLAQQQTFGIRLRKR
jgi:outer membrane protein